MSKVKTIILTVIFTIITYLIIIIVVPWLADVTVSVNTTLAASHNMDNYPGTSPFLVSVPWILYIVPAAIATIIIVITLKRGDD